jgi:hypothetical protein
MGQKLTCKGYADGRIAGGKNPDTGHVVKRKVGKGITWGIEHCRSYAYATEI